ncbi:MAG: acyltransferase family protein [Janthinobacterium lividum]
MTPGRFYRPQLDVVRFCAFLAVFGHHTLPRTGDHSRWLTTAADAMGFGLSLFFVLSAYLITLLLLREREQTGSIHLVPFYKRRALRIWPLYLLGIGIGVVRAVSHGVFLQQKTWFIAALLLSGNLIYPGTILMSHLWSISIEEQFYLFFPSACRTFGRRGMLLFALVLIVAANVTLIHFAHIHADLDVRVWFSSFVQFEMFAAGILLALADKHLPRWSVVVSLFASGGAALLWFGATAVFHLKTTGAVASSAAGLCVGYATVAAACCLLLVAVQGLPSPAPMVYSGKVSYGLYVFHLPVIALVSARFATYSVGVLVSMVLTYGLAALSYRYFELPFLQRRQHLQLIPTRAI